MENIIEDSNMNFDIEDSFENSELDFMGADEKKDVEKSK